MSSTCTRIVIAMASCWPARGAAVVPDEFDPTDGVDGWYEGDVFDGLDQDGVVTVEGAL
ncbi:hypothetical protein GCM10007856_29670 [Azospirillum oryzae]|nr:hypothetical protein [Azospirillum oryzae]GLR80289.1 hypothetical protein GCM10007856_29670 [Azospirillum oryzae]